MTHLFKYCLFVFVVSLVPFFSAVGSETIQELPGKDLKTTTSSAGAHILEGKLLNTEGEFWIVEDMSGNQHRIHIGTETTLPQTPKQQGDSIQAVVRKGGHASFIQ